MRRFVVGTAGHVDHGKTSLVRALTGVDTDRLPEEKRRGITIELGFARWRPVPDLDVSFVDVPGHRRFVPTMIAGASGIELVLLVVAADEGVMPQTREHVEACGLLGLRRVVVALTKIDRVDAELQAVARDEVSALLAGRLEGPVVPCSARTGAGLDALGVALAEALRALPPRPAAGPVRLGVDRVFSVRGAGTVVTGTLVAGRLEVGAAVRVLGRGEPIATVVRGLHVHDAPVPVTESPTRVAVNLAGIAVEAIRRGDVVTTDPSLAPTRLLDVAYAGEDPPPIVGVHLGAAHATARVAVLARPEGASHPEVRHLRLRLLRPLVAAGGDRFVLRGSRVEGPTGAVIGGGAVLDARPPAFKPKARRRAVLEALHRGDAPAALRALLTEGRLRPTDPAALGSRFPLPQDAIARAAAALVAKSEAVRLASGALVRRSLLEGLAAAGSVLVEVHHREHPHDRGLPRETLRRKLAERSAPEVADEAIRVAGQRSAAGPPAVVVEGDVVRAAAFDPRAAGGGYSAGPLGAATRALADAGLRGVTAFAIGEATEAPPKEVKAILARLVREGFAVVAGDLWFAADAVAALRAKVEAHLAASPRLTIADFKALSGLGRKQAIPLLERFDREGVTRREGDDRVRSGG